ncbi:transcriptional regulator [Streptomyces sp. CA-278952]|uniref:transcriptional regulator n=1 Tax=Streptomyces sp. CA-278952 TaxID=2980556 RepID=UPI00236845F9|nr:transcriptional regulator [Streptomyces sp. CA-278952]WDG26838.1 transcriptional regulator [Streptomyces sp. CA-278952]WDG33348.1 transcriptional regulator [Streptomyces sp. CA-278952]
MAGRWKDFGKYGADGAPGAEALGIAMEGMVRGVASPVDSDRGLAARLNYLTKSDAGYEAMDRAGVHVSPRTLMAWLAEERTPNKANLARLDAAYWDLRRRNVATDLKHRLNNGGRGTRVEINPVNQTGVDDRYRRDLAPRSINVRGVWDRAVDAWMDDDLDELDAVWDEVLDLIGSDYDGYSYVSSIGWAA